MYKHLVESERNLIDFLFNQEKKSISEIAKLLKRNKSTISREIKRNTINGQYNFIFAQRKYRRRFYYKYFFHNRKYFEFNKLFKEYYEKRYHGVYATINKISQHLNNIEHVSTRQVFRWIKSNKWIIKKNNRLRQYYKKGGKRTLGVFQKFQNKWVMPIWVRPKYIDLRQEFGHWEADLIIGKKANGFDNILTFTERHTRILFATKIKSKNPMKVNSALYELIKKNKLRVKSITIDNGIEFEKISFLASWIKAHIYFCEPYASYQRGTNENINGLIRRTWKKGTDFNEVSNKELDEVVNLINKMPRKILNWRTSIELFNQLNLN